MELHRSVNRHTAMIISKYFDDLRFTNGEVMIQKCSSLFVEIFAPWRRAVLIFNFFMCSGRF